MRTIINDHYVFWLLSLDLLAVTVAWTRNVQEARASWFPIRSVTATSAPKSTLDVTLRAVISMHVYWKWGEDVLRNWEVWSNGCICDTRGRIGERPPNPRDQRRLVVCVCVCEFWFFLFWRRLIRTEKLQFAQFPEWIFSVNAGDSQASGISWPPVNSGDKISDD